MAVRGCDLDELSRRLERSDMARDQLFGWAALGHWLADPVARGEAQRARRAECARPATTLVRGARVPQRRLSRSRAPRASAGAAEQDRRAPGAQPLGERSAPVAESAHAAQPRRCCSISAPVVASSSPSSQASSTCDSRAQFMEPASGAVRARVAAAGRARAQARHDRAERHADDRADLLVGESLELRAARSLPGTRAAVRRYTHAMSERRYRAPPQRRVHRSCLHREFRRHIPRGARCGRLEPVEAGVAPRSS